MVIEFLPLFIIFFVATSLVASRSVLVISSVPNAPPRKRASHMNPAWYRMVPAAGASLSAIT